MKKLNYWILMLAMSSLLLCTSSCSSEEDEPVQLTVQERLNSESPMQIVNSGVPISELYGKTYKGGLIFYLNTSDGTGLVAAESNQTNSNWGCVDMDIPNLNNVTELTSNETEEGARVGDGKANTSTILSACGSDALAAKVCVDYRGGGMSDWFLPSRGELNLVYKNLQLNGHSSFPTKDFYVTSTEYDANTIWVMSFDAGNRAYLGKNFDNAGYSLRAIRAF